MEQKLIESFESVAITEANYHVDNKADTRSDHFITDVSLNFYQLWTFFGCLPIVCNVGPMNEYIWKIKGPGSNFAIVGYGYKLLKINRWRVLTDKKDENLEKAFLENLLGALECYHTWYSGIGCNQFTSNREDIQQELDKIKWELIQIRDLVKEL